MYDAASVHVLILAKWYRAQWGRRLASMVGAQRRAAQWMVAQLPFGHPGADARSGSRGRGMSDGVCNEAHAFGIRLQRVAIAQVHALDWLVNWLTVCVHVAVSVSRWRSVFCACSERVGFARCEALFWQPLPAP